jgi:hypothetical protein
MLQSASTRRSSMDASYTALLLCCHMYGTSHPRTREALEDTRVTDPQGWVPLLLAGLAYPSLTKAPGVVKGSKEEAMVRGAGIPRVHKSHCHVTDCSFWCVWANISRHHRHHQGMAVSQQQLCLPC